MQSAKYQTPIVRHFAVARLHMSSKGRSTILPHQINTEDVDFVSSET